MEVSFGIEVHRCSIIRGKEHTVQTPKGTVIAIKMWGTLPYISKDDLQRIINDLPEDTERGRSGLQAQNPTAARVCKHICTPAQNRSHLKHLCVDMSKDKLNNVCSKYRNLPEEYYGGESSKFVSPSIFAKAAPMYGHVTVSGTVPGTADKPGGPQVKMWEWYSGSASLSSYLRDNHVSHLPPIDYRYGWNLPKREHQVVLLDALLTVGVEALFASPSLCTLGKQLEEYAGGLQGEKTR